MMHIAGQDRSQLLLLPESLDDYVGPENPVRFIEAFVDGLDLTAAGFARVTPKRTGRPGYAPADLLKLYIYGYLNRIRSSRRLEAETHRNIEVIWLLRHLKPDFKTIADFRRDNRKAFRPVFRQFVLLCRQLDLFGRELLAVDGTRIKAVNNKDRNFTRASLTKFIELADAKLDDYLQRLDQSDATERKTGGSRVDNLAEKIAAVRARRTRCQEMLAQLDRTGEDQISLTDPDSRAMAAHTHVAVGYNVQVAVDVKHKLIVEQQVTNQVVDMGRGWPKVPPSIAWWNGQTRVLTQTAEPAKEILDVETIDVVAAKGYFKIEDIEACEKAGIVPYVPRPQRGPSVKAGYFRKDEFQYDAGNDSYVCPAGQRLYPYSSSLLRGLKKVNYVNKLACDDCKIRSQCTGGKFRTVSRLENEAVLDRMQARLAKRPDILDHRRETVEHPFGTIKQWMHQGTFLMRGLEKVRAEFSLTALAYNLRRVLNIVGFAQLMAAVAA
jgi:transposase